MDTETPVSAIDCLKTRNAVLEADIKMYENLLEQASTKHQELLQEIARLNALVNVWKSAYYAPSPQANDN
jgi:prefoldin subunit 5